MNYRVIIVVLISLAAISCSQKPLEKPFTIILSDPCINSTKYSRYEYQDKNGIKMQFFDEKGKFKVGDTL